MSNGGSMSIGSLGSFGSCSSCAGRIAANNTKNESVTRRFIVAHYLTQPTQTEAERDAREELGSPDSRAMDFDDRERKETALKPPVEQSADARRFRRPADIKSIALMGLFVLASFYT